MRRYFFKLRIEGYKTQIVDIKAVKLHTALHRLGEEIDKTLYKGKKVIIEFIK